METNSTCKIYIFITFYKFYATVARWLHQDYYQPLCFSENPEKIYYAMAVDDIEMTHYGLSQGYLDITMRCNTYHAYSREYLSETYDLSTNNINGTEIQISNYGDLDIKPDIWIKKIGNGGLEIINRSNKGEITSFCSGASGKGILKFTGTVLDGETVTIGDKVYEFDTGDGVINENVKQWVQGYKYIDGTIINKSGILYQCIKTNTDENWNENHWKKLDKSNIRVDVNSDASPSQAKLVFNNTPIKDGDSITIGNNTYEFDFDDVYEAKHGYIPISLKNYVKEADGKLIARNNLDFAGSKIKIGDKEYTIMPHSGEGTVIVNNKNYKGFDDWLLDSYYETDQNYKDIMLLMNEKKDNTLNGIRIPRIDKFVNDRIDKTKQIIELYKPSKYINIPEEGDADTWKFEPIPVKIDKQCVGDELTIFKRDSESFKLDMIYSTTEKIYIEKGNEYSYSKSPDNKRFIINSDDIIMITKRYKEPDKADTVPYKNQTYIKSEFEFLKVKKVGETNNDSLIKRHTNGTVWYELETPSKIFTKNPLFSYGIGKTIYGNSIDIKSAKMYMVDLGYEFIITEKIPEDELKSMIKTGDVVVGSKGAIGGVSFDTEGVERIGGTNRFETRRLISEKYYEIRKQFISVNENHYYHVIVFRKQKEKILIQPSLQLTAPYQIRMGDTLDETCENIVKAINEEGKDWVEYSKGTYAHDDVRASYDKTSKIINIKAKENGTKGNKIVTIVNDWEAVKKLLENGYQLNQFEYPHLVNGKDAIYNELDNTNGKSLIAYIVDVLKLNEDKMNISFSNNTINIISKKYGSLNNIIPILSNCYSCNFYNMNDNPSVTLEDGKDPSINTILQALQFAINNNSTDVVSDIDLTKQILKIIHREIGKHTNINVSTTAINAYWNNGKKLYGGKDSLINGEEIYIEGESGHIESDKNKNIVDVYNGNDLVLKYGVNNLLIKGDCFIRFKTKYKFL